MGCGYAEFLDFPLPEVVFNLRLVDRRDVNFVLRRRVGRSFGRGKREVRGNGSQERRNEGMKRSKKKEKK